MLKIDRDMHARGYTQEAVIDTILGRMDDYVRYILPQFSRTHINFQRVPKEAEKFGENLQSRFTQYMQNQELSSVANTVISEKICWLMPYKSKKTLAFNFAM